MEREQKLAFGKILGEIYRLQKNSDEVACPVGDETIFGLLNGLEYVVDSEIQDLCFISKKKHDDLINILDEYFVDPEKMSEFNGYYDIEYKVRAAGIERWEAIRILTYLKANGQFVEMIEKMDSSGSPSECRHFNISEWEK